MRPSVRLLLTVLGSLVLVLSFSEFSAAQTQVPPLFVPAPASVHAELPISDSDSPPRFRLEALPADQLDIPPTTGYRAGINRQLPLAALRAGEWSTDKTGLRHWHVRIESPDATGIRLHFTHFAAGSGKVWIHDASKDQVFGPYIGNGRFGDGDFWTEMIFASSLDLEYSPGGPETELPFEVSEIFHSWLSSSDGPGKLNLATNCFLDSSCYVNTSFINDQVDATVLLVFPNSTCSGTLIADRNHTKAPLLLTAGHCVTSASDARAMLAVFRYKTNSCSDFTFPPSLDPRQFQQVAGATLLSRSLDSPGGGGVSLTAPDFALVMLSQPPPTSVLFAGWNFSYTNGQSLYSVSHPLGLPSSFAKGAVMGTVTPDFFQVGMFQGRTDHGSSGSGIFNEGVQLMGVLSAGQSFGNDSACLDPRNEPIYTRFAAIYPYVSTWLEGTTTTDTTAPILTISSHTNAQTVTSTSITISGSATDAGRGDNGISSVTVNGVRASGDTSVGSGTATWSRSLILANGVNTITVVAKDNSPNQNSTTVTLTINVVVPKSATASTYHVFPQIADGRLPDGTYYRTTLMISNPSSTNGANCTVQLRGLTAAGIASSYQMGPNGWIIDSTNANQSFRSGYAALQCSASVEAQLLYAYYSAGGTKISEATVFSSLPAGSLQLLGDNRDGARIGMAVANDSDQNNNLTVTAYDNSGRFVGSNTLTLGARSNLARFVDELISLPINYYGQVFVTSSVGTVSLIGLRFTGPTFTTIPGTTRNSVAPTASTYHVFPQFADGRASDGSYYRTTIMIANPTSVSGNCTFQLYGLTVNGSSAFGYNFAAGGWTLTNSISSNQPLRTGYATLNCSMAVEAQLLYSFYSPSGTKLSEATVFSSPASSLVQVLADTREGARIGLALANDSDQNATFVVAAGDIFGNVIGTATLTLGPRTARASFLDQLMNLPPGNFGQVLVSSGTANASIIGLRFTGLAFTTIPQTIR